MSGGLLSTRAMFRNIMILACLLLAVVTYVAFRYGQQMRVDIQALEFERIALVQELQNTARRSANLSELDDLTISEAEATRLNIMRHLGLEQTNYDFTVTSRQIRQVGETELYTREAVLKTLLPYGETMALIDRLYNTGKLAIQSIVLKAPAEEGELVALDMVGYIYALRKEGRENLPNTPQPEPDETQPQEEAQQPAATQPSPSATPSPTANAPEQPQEATP